MLFNINIYSIMFLIYNYEVFLIFVRLIIWITKFKLHEFKFYINKQYQCNLINFNFNFFIFLSHLASILSISMQYLNLISN